MKLFYSISGDTDNRYKNGNFHYVNHLDRENIHDDNYAIDTWKHTEKITIDVDWRKKIQSIFDDVGLEIQDSDNKILVRNAYTSIRRKKRETDE